MARLTYNDINTEYADAGEYFNGGEQHTLSVDEWDVVFAGSISPSI